ncbi:MAG: ribonuclease R [Cytophagaceae bacterium]|jgi:ribonuclease R|nr:ribonuclease R [Cytophagaceae bacterium]
MSQTSKSSSGDLSNLGLRVIKFFDNSSQYSFGYRELLKKFSITKEKDKQRFKILLDTLVKEGKLHRLPSGSFTAVQRAEEGSGFSDTAPEATGKRQLITGRVDFVNPRFAYVIPITTDGKAQIDVWVSHHHMANALDGDIVKVFLHKASGRSKSPEGEIIEIIERRRTEFVGKIQVGSRHAFVVPDSRRMHVDIFVPQDKINGAKNGEKVIVKINQWASVDDKNPTGEVVEILGKAGENETEMHAIMAEFGLPWEFPDTVNRAANEIPTTFTPEEISKRKDFRGTTTFTIDPEDAKDFDDALSFKSLENGHVEIGIHIADVSHYVTPGSILDREAYNRATSVYLVDRCVPMLPEKLSNELCSLRPNEDKLTFSAVFELDADGKIYNEWFGRTIIHSIRRFSYEEAQTVLETGVGDLAYELHTMNEIAKKMRTERFRKGAISFETIEVKFKLDPNGKPLAVIPKIRKDAHKMIEDYMLLANRKVAEYVHFLKKGKQKNTMVFRIHEHPDPDKLKSLALFAKKFGHRLSLEDEGKIAQELNQLTEEVEGKPEQNVLQSLAIRTMSKAKYSTDPEIHFGLAFKHYTHFTSPIRRYPDVMAHRLLQHYLDGGESAEREAVEEQCVHASQMEKLAAEAERSSIKYKQVEFMQSTVGEIFEGIVSGVTEFGMFVEIIATKCEGMVRLSEMNDDYYEVDMDNYRIVGKRNKRMITLGDTVQVKVRNTSLEKRTIDLELLSKQ